MKRCLVLLFAATSTLNAMEASWLEKPLLQEMEVEAERQKQRQSERPHEKVIIWSGSFSYEKAERSLQAAQDFLFWAEHWCLLPKDIQKIIIYYLEWDEYCKTFGCFIGKDVFENKKTLAVHTWKVPEVIQFGRELSETGDTLLRGIFYQLFCCCVCYGLPRDPSQTYCCGICCFDERCCGPLTPHTDQLSAYSSSLARDGCYGRIMKDKKRVQCEQHRFQWGKQINSSGPNKLGIYTVGPHISSIQDSKQPQTTQLDEDDILWRGAVHPYKPVVILSRLGGILRLCFLVLNKDNAIQSIKTKEYGSGNYYDIAFLAKNKVAFLSFSGSIHIYTLENDTLTFENQISAEQINSMVEEENVLCKFAQSKEPPYLTLECLKSKPGDSCTIAIDPKTGDYIFLQELETYKNPQEISYCKTIKNPCNLTFREESGYMTALLLASAAKHWITCDEPTKEETGHEIMELLNKIPMQDRLRIIWYTTSPHDTSNLFEEIRETLCEHEDAPAKI